MQRHQIDQRTCGSCRRPTKHERAVTAMGCGDLVLVWITLGLWLAVRAATKPPYRCCKCGKAN